MLIRAVCSCRMLLNLLFPQCWLSFVVNICHNVFQDFFFLSVLVITDVCLTISMMLFVCPESESLSASFWRASEFQDEIWLNKAASWHHIKAGLGGQTYLFSFNVLHCRNFYTWHNSWKTMCYCNIRWVIDSSEQESMFFIAEVCRYELLIHCLLF